MAEGHGGARPGSGRWSKDELEALKRGDSDDLVSRIKGRSFASIRAKRAELKRKPKETEKTDLEKIAAEPKKAAGTSLAMARVIEASKALKAQESRRHELNPFQVAQHPPRATPPKKYQMAMDQSVGWASNAWLGEVGGVLASAGAEGLFFLGYPFLAELAQRSEYRVISETIADDATRKWIDFEVTGSETEKEPSIEDPEEMREAGALDKSPEAVEAENALESKTRGFKDEDPDERKKKIESAGKMDKVKALKDEMARLELRDRFYNISRDDGFFGRSHLFMDFGVDLDDNRGELGHDIGDGRNKTTQGKIEKGSLKRLKVIEPVWIYPTTYNATNPLKEDWYNPQIWYVMGKMVHASRMPTFVGHPVPDLLKPAYSFGGLALSQMAKPYVDIWLTTRESIGSLIHSFSVMCLETDMQTALQGSGFDNVMMRVAMFNALRDNQGTFVTNKSTEGFKNVSAPLSGLHELQAQAQEHMASVSRIPLVKLTGISPSGLNASSEGEIRAYYDTIAAYQNRFFRPHLTKVLNFMQLSLWGEIDPEITFEFEPLWEMSQKEKSEKEKDDATRDQTYVDIGAFSPGEIRKIKIDDPTLPYTDMDPEDVPDLREEEEQGLEPQGGRPQPLAEAGPELGEGGIEPSGRGQDESPERSGLAWNDQYEWMRGYDLPTTRRDGAVIVKEAPQGSIARGKGLRVGSRVRLADGSTGRVFGFVQNAGGDSGVSVAVLDTERDRVVFPAEEAVSTRPVAAEDEWRGGGQDASLVPFGGDVDPLFAGDAGFEETEHPRAESGKFTSKGGGGETTAKASESAVPLGLLEDVETTDDVTSTRAEKAVVKASFDKLMKVAEKLDDEGANPQDNKQYGALNMMLAVMGKDRSLSGPERKNYQTTYALGNTGMVGAGSIRRTGSDTAEVMHLGSLQNGVGQKVLTSLENKAKNIWGVKKLRLTATPAAASFYKRQGWKPAPGEDEDDFIFEKDLSAQGQDELTLDTDEPDYLTVGDADFEERDHPRAEGGKFKSKGGAEPGATSATAIKGAEPSKGWWKEYQAKKGEGGGKFRAPQLGLPYGAASQPSFWSGGEKAAPAPPPKPLDPKKLKRVGEQMGSNPGGVFEDESGKRYYVKQGKSAEHVKNELLAAALYKLAGTPLLKYRAVEGGKHIATEMAKLDKDNANNLSPSEIKEARKDFVPHAWLANWDAAGLGGDNLGTVKGVPTALDLGGSLAYRAQGAPKGEAFGTKVGELDSLRDPKVNKDTAKIFGEMTPSEMRESASYVTNVRDSDIKRAVKEAGVDASMADKLIARKNDIAQRAKTFGAEGKPDKPTSTVIFPAGDELPVKELNGVAFKPWRPPADWAGVEGQNESLEEPPLDTKGKQASSGLIMREPDGRVWMVRPKGGFGGYEHTFSKGRVDKGLSLQANAIKETWEESGLKGKIVGFAGDHEGDTTMTRYYLAEREGGDPSQHDQETDGVVLAPPNKLSGFLNRKRDQDIAKSLGGDQALDEDGASGFSHIDRSFETSLEDRDETKLDKLGYLQGLKKIKMEPDHDQWNSRYDGEKDEIVLEGKFEDLDDQEKMRTLLHEAGHRGQLLADTEGFEEFKKRGLAKEEFFVEMANKTHMEDFERRGVVDGEAGEVFAESYARFCLGMDLPEVLAEFWSEREKALETDTALDAEFKESDDGAMDEFEESEHPRGEGGKFASKGGSEQTKTFKNFTPSTSPSHHLSQVEKVLASPSKSGTTFRWMVNMLIKEIPKFPASASPEMAKLRAQSLRMKIAMSWDKERMKAKAKGDDALVQKITQKMKKLGWTGEPSPTPAKEAPKTSAEIMEKVKTASQEPATAQELEKAKKTVALQVQYVPGHEYAPSDAVEKLVEAFNKKYAGKEMTSEQALKTKVGDFKALKTAVAEMGAKTKAEQEKVQAENAVKQQAAAAKQAAEQAEQLKKQAQAEKEKAAKIHAENKEFMDALGISEAEAEGVKGLLKMLGAGTTTSLADFKKEAASSVKHLGHNMTGIEAALISKYKHGSSFVNEEMRKPMASWDESVVAAAKVLNKALSKLPAYKEVTVRNTPLSKDIQMRYQPGKVVMEHGFTGTSKKKPHGVFSGNTRFYVTPKAGGGRGKDISAMFGFHGEEEVLYQAHTMFRVDKVEGSPGGSGNASYSVYMTEVEY